MNLPKKTFARKIIRMKGWYDEQEIIAEVAAIDGVSLEEAARRVSEAMKQRSNRAVAQFVRRRREASDVNLARLRVLLLASLPHGFICSEHLSEIACTAKWKNRGAGEYWDTARAFREICMPLEKDGLLQELRDEDDRFFGYSITAAGRKAVSS